MFRFLPIHTPSGFNQKIGWTTKHEIKVQAVEEENLLEPSSAGSDAIFDTIRVARETINLNNNQNNKINNDQEQQPSEKANDQQVAPAEIKTSAVDELTLDSIEDDENRGKRFVFMIDGRRCKRIPN